MLQALGQHTAVPVPRVLFFEDDPAVFGSPFVVMERVDGKYRRTIRRHRRRVGARSEPRRRSLMWWTTVSRPSLRSTTPTGIRSGSSELDPAPGGDHLGAQLDYWRNFFTWAAAGEPNPTIEYAFGWLADNKPTEPRHGRTQRGDARVCNIIFARRPLGGSRARLGDDDHRRAGTRSGVVVLPERHHTEGIGTHAHRPSEPAGTVARYQQLTGHTVENLDYYEFSQGCGSRSSWFGQRT